MTAVTATSPAPMPPTLPADLPRSARVILKRAPTPTNPDTVTSLGWKRGASAEDAVAGALTYRIEDGRLAGVRRFIYDAEQRNQAKAMDSFVQQLAAAGAELAELPTNIEPRTFVGKAITRAVDALPAGAYIYMSPVSVTGRADQVKLHWGMVADAPAGVQLLLKQAGHLTDAMSPLTPPRPPGPSHDWATAPHM